MNNINNENPTMISGITIGIDIVFDRNFLPENFEFRVVVTAARSPNITDPVAEIDATFKLVIAEFKRSESSKTALNHRNENFVQTHGASESLNENTIKNIIGIYKKINPNIKKNIPNFDVFFMILFISSNNIHFYLFPCASCILIKFPILFVHARISNE